jgi:hypothetical protein
LMVNTKASVGTRPAPRVVIRSGAGARLNP